MTGKDSRLKMIKRLLKSDKISSQEDLLLKLNTEGFNVTQATLSRDLKNLNVCRISDGLHGYYFSLPEDSGFQNIQTEHLRDLARGMISLSFSNNIGVIKTHIGHANTVAFAIDTLKFDEVLGTIAGDDTIFFIVKENSNIEKIINQFQEIVPGLEVK
ncbi:MAG: arginine repressor [Spirochaetales bacterium]|nr:arginine repressor [Spirochaetales bacterium]